MADNKSKVELHDLSRLNDAAKKALENVSKEAVKAGRTILASAAIIKRRLKNDISITQSNR